MVKRYSGQVTVDVEFVDAKNQYRARVTAPDGTETVWVGVPPALRVAVDSPEAYDGAASAAMSFAEDDYPDLGVADAADYGDSGWAISRKKPGAKERKRRGAREGEGLMDLTERARKIVRLAASTKSSAQHWLQFDEYGTWERRAAEQLRSTAEKVVELGLTPSQVDEEIAIQLRVEALQAMLADAKKKKKGRR